MMQMPLVLPLFLEGNHFSSTLTLVNNSTANTYADVTVRALDGSVIVARRVNFSPHSQQQVGIDELLGGKGSSATAGSILVMQSSALAGPSIAGALAMTYLGSADPNYIDEEPSMLNMMGSQMLQGVADRANGSPIVAISSVAEAAQHVNVECLGEHGTIASKQIELAPGETLLADACGGPDAPAINAGNDLFEGMAVTAHGPLGIRLTSDAMPGSFAAFAVTPHRKNGDRYLSSVLFADPMLVNSPNTVFTGIPVGPATLLPDGNYTPEISVVNFSTSDIHVHTTFAQTSGSSPNSREVGSLTVLPGSSRELELDGLKGDPGLQNSFIVHSDGAPGALMAKLVSTSDSQLHEVELQAKDESDMNNAGNHPWSIEQNTESTLLLFNHSATQQPFDLTITGAGISWQKTYKLASMQTKAISIGELVADQVKDENGNVLPKTAQSGELNWMVVDPNNGSGRLLQSDRSTGMARNFSCGYSGLLCGANVAVYESVVPAGSVEELANITPVTCTSGTQNTCTGQPTGSGGNFSYSWWSENTSVASISGSAILSYVDILGVSLGTTRIDGQVHSQYCTVQGFEPETVPDQTPVITGIDPGVWDSSPTVPVTTQVTFTGQYFGTNAPTLSFSPSAGIGVTSFFSYSDTQIVANITVAAGTPTEDVAVTVTNNGYGAGNSFYGGSGSGANSATSQPGHARVNAPANAPEVTVIAWINGQAPDIVQTVNAGPTTSLLKSNLTGGAVSCLAQLTAWYAGFRLNLVTATDAAYANAWMFQNAANTTPPTTLTTPASTSQLTGGFKLFNDFGGTGTSNTAQIGKSPDPCPGAPAGWFSLAGATNQWNEYSSMSNSGWIYQINEGAMTLPAQVLFITINQHSTPWIWSVIEFSSSGSTSSVSNQIFPTYYTYVNGALVNGPAQGPLANFTVLNGTNSEMTPTLIQ